MDQEPLRNPFRSEQDAFRLLLIIGAAVAAIVVAANLGGPWVGVPVAAVLIGAGARASFRWLRRAMSERDPAPGAGRPVDESEGEGRPRGRGASD